MIIGKPLFTVEQIQTRPGWADLLQNIDVLIDGRFELALKSLNLRFRGSSNQCAIDVRQSLKQQKKIEIDI